MSNPVLGLSAHRRLALTASRQLERWALRPQQQEHLRREALAYEQALEERARFALDAIARTLLR
jgi:hypothetical protein